MVALSISVPLLWASTTSLTTSPARSWKPEASDPTHALSCDEPLTCRPVSTAPSPPEPPLRVNNVMTRNT